MGSTDDGTPSLSGFYRRVFRRLPWWVALALGVAAAALGATITAKPFASLGVLIGLVAASFIIVGVSELASATNRSERIVGVAWIAVGIAVAAWQGLSIRGLAIIVGVSLLVGGLARIVTAVRGRPPDGRAIPLFSGLSRAIFGVLALSWPDVTVLVTALLVGPAMMVYGIGQVWSALRRRDDPAGTDRSSQRRFPGWLRLAGGVVSLASAAVLLLVSALIHRSSNEPGAFFDPPDTLPGNPGSLVRSEAFTTAVPDGARAWRILYTTTRDDRTPAVASAIVMVSANAPAGPRPVIAWAHGTTGYASKCAPSLLKDGFQAGAMPAKQQILDNGWILVATDYVGLGTEGPHPYLIGEPVARSLLDAVRAVRSLDGIEPEPRTIVWGHSQGGGVALWTGIIAPEYAPDTNVTGVAALAPATRLPELLAKVRDTPVGKIMGSYVMSAYSAVYPDVAIGDYIRPAAEVLVRETAERCLSGPEALVSVGTAVGDEPYFSRNPAEGALGRRLEENVPNRPIEAPLLIAQGLTDALVLPAVQEQYIAARCAAGQQIQYRTYSGFDHVGVVLAPTSPLVPDLLEWTQDRLRGVAQDPGCERIPARALPGLRGQ